MEENDNLKNTPIVLLNRIEQRIFTIRETKVMVDADLAELYGVTTKRLNEQVKRNRDRFPADFMFRLTEDETHEVVANCDHLGRLKFSRYLPTSSFSIAPQISSTLPVAEGYFDFRNLRNNLPKTDCSCRG